MLCVSVVGRESFVKYLSGIAELYGRAIMIFLSFIGVFVCLFVSDVHRPLCCELQACLLFYSVFEVALILLLDSASAGV